MTIFGLHLHLNDFPLGGNCMEKAHKMHSCVIRLESKREKTKLCNVEIARFSFICMHGFVSLWHSCTQAFIVIVIQMLSV